MKERMDVIWGRWEGCEDFALGSRLDQPGGGGCPQALPLPPPWLPNASS